MDAQKNIKTILVSPLDWGLGHATRCIPIIRELQKQGCKVMVAASGAHATLLQQEFTDIQILPLKGYQISYGKGNLMLQLLRQLPRFLKTIQQENKWLEKAITQWKIDGIISDNRYGLHTSKVPTVFITHQLQVQAPGWLKWLERPAQKSIYQFINQFNECWVPDAEEPTKSIASQLSHPTLKPNVPVKYIGWLTRFVPKPVKATKKYQLLISLSGPEPQRTLLENLLLSQLSALQKQVLLIRGLPGNTQLPAIDLPNLTVVNHLSGMAMQEAMAKTEIFLSRCGYSTLMDLQTVACKCIFIPTPGQTEQEYLGKQIAQSGKAVVLPQNNFDLQQAMQQVENCSNYSPGNYHNELLPDIIKNWLASIS